MTIPSSVYADISKHSGTGVLSIIKE